MNKYLVLVYLVVFLVVFLNRNDWTQTFLEELKNAIVILWLKYGLSNEDFHNIVSYRDEQKVCLAVTLVCLKLMVVVTYFPRKLNLFAQKCVELACWWGYVLCSCASELFLHAPITSTMPLLVWCCSTINDTNFKKQHAK